MRNPGLKAHWHLAPSHNRETTALLSAVEQAVEAGEGAFRTYLSEPHRGAWWGRLALEDGDLFVKARRPKHPRQRWASLLLPRGLTTEWRQSLWYQARGLPCADPVALGEYRSFGMLDLSVVVFRWVPHSRSLADAATAADQPTRHRLIQETGTLLGNLFRQGVIHRQPHPRNILCVPDLETGLEMLMPIDLQHLWISSELSDNDFLWALDQVSFWLHDPVIDWSDRVASCLFYRAAIDAAETHLQDTQRIRNLSLPLIERGRTATKLHRHEWQPDINGSR